MNINEAKERGGRLANEDGTLAMLRTEVYGEPGLLLVHEFTGAGVTRKDLLAMLAYLDECEEHEKEGGAGDFHIPESSAWGGW